MGQQRRDTLNRDVVLPQAWRLGFGRHRIARRRGRGFAFLLRGSELVFPIFLRGLEPFDMSLPLAQPVGKVADHPLFEHRQNIT